jgi:catechol 2,3-dioxygenase-like lactoylglutathione lyase family enzyme
VHGSCRRRRSHRSECDRQPEWQVDEEDRTYDLGTGYGHIALAVDDLDETLEQLKAQGIEPEREPYRVHEGGSRTCFVRDPDGSLPTLNRRPADTSPCAWR